MTSSLDISPTQSVTGLEALFAPRAVAVVGASTTPGKLGAVMAQAVASYDAPIALVNPRGEGMHPSIGAAADALDSPIDLAILCVPASVTADGYRSLMNITPCPMNTPSSMVTPAQTNEWLEILQFFPMVTPFCISTKVPTLEPSSILQP